MQVFLNNLTNILHNKVSNSSSTLLIGDFNLTNTEWVPDTNTNALYPSCSSNAIENMCIDNMSYNNFHQYNYVKNKNGKILDLVCSNFPLNISITPIEDTNSAVPPDDHHPAIEVNFVKMSESIIKSNNIPSLNFYLTNYEAVNEVLSSIDWNEKLGNISNVDLAVDIFYATLMPIISKHTPLRKPRNEKYPVWYSPALLKCIKEKKKYHTKYKKFNNLRDKLTFVMLRDRCDELIRECHTNFKKNAADHLKQHPKKFWKYVNDLKRNSNSLPNEMTLNGIIAKGGQDICDLFSLHFQSVYSNYSIIGSTTQLTGDNFVTNNLALDNFTMTEEEVLKKLKELDGDKAPGPDQLPPFFLKKCAYNLVKPLTKIFQLSLKTSCYPTKWKLAYLTPIHKSGDYNNIAYYRPISNLSACGKVLESLVQKYILSHVKNQINENQHGFLPKKSTASNLVSYVSYLSDALDKQNEVHAIYTDFSKAFDLVNHRLLLRKIEGMGIHGSLLRWCESYLSNRSQLVYIKGFRSVEKPVPSGVPQGSHLGPLFFLIFINDLSNIIKSEFKFFADDLKLYRIVKDIQDCQLIQNDLNNIYKWCTENCMSLNAEKCLHIKFTRKKHPMPANYSINHTSLKEVNSIRDLGIIIDSSLSFRHHIDNIINKTSKLSGFINRQMKSLKRPSVTVVIYNTLVRGILEYCSTVWNPSYQVHIDRIERVQKRFLYHLAYSDQKCRTFDSYSDRLRYYKMSPLNTRRKLLDICFLFKIIHGHINCPELLQRVNFSIPRSSSRLQNRKTFSLPQSKSNLGLHSPIYRMCSSTNYIRDEIDIFCGSITSLKSSLKRIL
ncbi:hypothetical protein JYU34_008326 [Plutella xylostella]|uniref:Reverse transcriptase domain-containing protein n=1 Tax=Plutella xylostella TaxID=51655 RepID=A0ABQ7QP94_PLUXY|nr:hypothetical protein JYU34_008326 [Plutella xylostella]